MINQGIYQACTRCNQFSIWVPSSHSEASRKVNKQCKHPLPAGGRRNQRLITRIHASLQLTNGATSRESRTPAAKAALFTGTYAMIAGMALLIAPNTVFGLLFNPHEVTTGWIRFGGILLSLIGMQYFGAGFWDSSVSLQTGQPTSNTAEAATDNHALQPPRKLLYSKGFYSASVWSRLFLCVGCTALALTGQMPRGVMVLAALNFLGAMSMWLALRTTDQLLHETQYT